MKANINYKVKRVDVGVVDLIDAGWCGFNFARCYPDLVKAGWVLHYYSVGSSRFDADTVRVSSVSTLADLIRQGPPKPHYERSTPVGTTIVIQPYPDMGIDDRPRVEIITERQNREHRFILPVDEVVAAVRGERVD